MGSGLTKRRSLVAVSIIVQVSINSAWGCAINQSLITSGDLDAVMAAALATGLLSSTCTIQEPSGVFGASGAPDGVWVNVAGLIGLECQAAPVSLLGSALGGTENKMPQEILSKQPLHVLLDGNYPTITTKMRAVIDSVDYDIESIEHDSQGRMTRLLVTVNGI